MDRLKEIDAEIERLEKERDEIELGKLQERKEFFDSLKDRCFKYIVPNDYKYISGNDTFLYFIDSAYINNGANDVYIKYRHIRVDIGNSLIHTRIKDGDALYTELPYKSWTEYSKEVFVLLEKCINNCWRSLSGIV